MAALPIATSLLLMFALPWLHTTESYPGGAPPETCSTMSPKHQSLSAQQRSPPFVVTAGKPSVAPGSTLKLMLTSTTGSPFKGFLLQARQPEGSNYAIGQFTVLPNLTKTITCAGGHQNSPNTVTHADPSERDSLQFEWEAPDYYEGPVVFVSSKVCCCIWCSRCDRSNPAESACSLLCCVLVEVADLHPHTAQKATRRLRWITSVTPRTPYAATHLRAPEDEHITQDPPSGSTDPYLIKTTCNGSTVPVLCAVSVWRHIQDLCATVVQDFSTFWLGVKSDTINVAKRAVDNSSQSTGISTTRQPVVTTVGSTTSPTFFSTAPPPRRASVVTDPIYDGCGSKKTCFGFPGDCVESKSCTAVVSCLVGGETYEFDMKARNSDYVAVGLSQDANMGDDSVVECVRDGTGGNGVNAYMSWNFGKNNRRLQFHDGIDLKNSSSVDGTIYCKFTRKAVTKVEDRVFDLAKDKYHLLIASGPLREGGGVGYHGAERAAAELSLSLADVSIVAGSSNLLLRLHGAFMIGAWIGTAGIGILLARYFKQTWAGSQLCGKDQWFAWHRMFMLLTWGLTISAFVLIFVHLKDWSAEDNPHAILGCATTALAFVQPIGAAFRPHPDSRRRPIFNWLHWLVGNVAHILGIVTIFFATKLTKAELPSWMDWFLVGYVAFHVAVHLILSIASIASERNGSKRVNSFPMKEMTNSRSPLHSPDRKQDSPHSCFRKFMLAVYILVILLLVAALIIITVFAPIEKNWVKFQNMIAPNSTQEQ